MARSLPMMFVGDHERGEFREAARWLEERGAEMAADIPAAIGTLEGGFCPAMIVVAEAWPGEFSAREIGQLRRAAPLARFIGLLGSWLEGETRTGTPWPLVERRYWHRWSSRRMDDNRSFLTPATATDDDRLLAAMTVDRRSEPETNNSVIGVCAASRDTADSLADVCRQSGCESLWLGSDMQAAPAGVDLILFDAMQVNDREIQRLAALRSSLESVPIVVIVGFPRTETVDQLLAAGATAVVSKPLLVADLVEQIGTLTHS